MGSMDRRGFVTSLAGAAAVLPPTWAAAQSPAGRPAPQRFSFDEVIRRARDLATAPLSPPPALPEQLSRLGRAAERDIRFKPERELFATPGSRFRLALTHLGATADRPLTINLIRDGIATPIPYAANLFDFGAAKFDRPLPINLGFGGLRLKFPLNDPGRYDDALVFTAASRFAFRGRGQRNGAAVRALAVNGGLDNEEFPFFREFWLQTPDANAGHMTLYGLLDGESVTGAFRFEVAPGAESRLDVAATLFPRRLGGQIGFAPIESMFLSGPSQPRAGLDYRPAAHSSDGLAIRTGAGEWLWRPLRNPSRSEQFAFLDRNPRGFGLLQRDRDFARYQDIEQAYELRPSYWVEPTGDWGEGQLQLTERPTSAGRDDNVLVTWQARDPREPGKPVEIGYRLFCSLDGAQTAPPGRVVETFGTAASGDTARAQRYLVDFAGGDLAYFLGDPARVEAVADARNGAVAAVGVAANPHIQGFRAFIEVEPAEGQTADARLFLRAGGRTLTETWTLPISDSA